jgi:hypothetical protein
MFEQLKAKVNQFYGRGSSSIFVPPMDGRLRPNDKLDDLEVYSRISNIDNMVSDKRIIYASSLNLLLKITNGVVETLQTFKCEITAITIGDGGILAIGLNDKKVVLYSLVEKIILDEIEINCVTGLLFWDSDNLLIASGSNEFLATEWRSDLLNLGSSGSIWQYSILKKRKKKILSKLKWPVGLCKSLERLIFTESWNHSVSSIEFTNNFSENVLCKTDLLLRLPGYPGRIIQDENKHFWLCIFAPRNQLIEFVLTEKSYRSKMISQVDQKFWIAPTFRSGTDFREPLQGGGVKMMGVLKPWSPVFSYGLIIKLDQDFQPILSLHSRANGHAHGITSAVCPVGGEILVSSRGNDKILRCLNQ